MYFPEHMDYRCYITPERMECFELYSQNGGIRTPYLAIEQDFGQCLIDLYYTDFMDVYRKLSAIKNLVSTLSCYADDGKTWEQLAALTLPLYNVHPFFGVLVKELSDLERACFFNCPTKTDAILCFDREVDRLVQDAKVLIEDCLDDRPQPDYTTAERYREAHHSGRLCLETMRYGELATEEMMRPVDHSTYNFDVEMLRERNIVTVLREVLYPNTVLDLYAYLKAYCLRLPVLIHKCKHCGRYFVVTGNITQEYCTRRMEGSEKTCRQMGAVLQYQSRQMQNPATKAFTRAYKAHNARIRYGTMTREAFAAWSLEARRQRDLCVAGTLSLEDFTAWLGSDRQS